MEKEKVLRIKQKYRVNECCLVTKNVLVSLMGHYDGNYPKLVQKKMVELLEVLDRDLEKRHVLPNEDITSVKLYEEYTYEKPNCTR